MDIPIITVETQPAEATVFPDRARVTRRGRTDLAAGLQRLEVENLPLALMPASVRAAGHGTARAKLLGVSTRLENFTDTPAQATRDLEQHIQTREDAEADLAARAGVVEREQKHLDDLAAQSESYARGLAFRNRSPADQAAIFDFISGRSRALQTELLSLARERRENAKELNRLKRELSAQQSARPRQRYTAVVEVEVIQAGEFTLDLTYVVNGANWHPLYDLRLVDQSVDLTYMAEVSQNTGEAWPGVGLTLSTARPSLSLTIPELDPWFVRPRPIEPPRLRKAAGPMAFAAQAIPAPAAAPAPVEAAARAAVPEPPELDLVMEDATVSAAGASLTYRLSGQADVPGNGEPRKVTVASLKLKPDFTYITAPKLEAVCYRRAEFKNDSAYSILPGRLQLFEGDEYLGATDVEFVAPGQTFELALGADERLRVEREMVAREVDKAFVIGDRRRIRYAFEIEVENLRDSRQTLVVRDQFPVSRDEQIKVKLDSAEPKPAEVSELNVLEWKLTLDPSAKRKLRFDFNVEHPRSLDVIGLI
jgi:uncharacterized protein (TIGR02231 family)